MAKAHCNICLETRLATPCNEGCLSATLAYSLTLNVEIILNSIVILDIFAKIDSVSKEMRLAPKYVISKKSTIFAISL